MAWCVHLLTVTTSQPLVQQHKPPQRFHQQLSSVEYCSSNGQNASFEGTYMTPDKPESFQPLHTVGAWSFREDRPGKPGEEV
jgi:hypothetical protein